jgi:hypothetical protein
MIIWVSPPIDIETEDDRQGADTYTQYYIVYMRGEVFRTMDENR